MIFRAGLGNLCRFPGGEKESGAFRDVLCQAFFQESGVPPAGGFLFSAGEKKPKDRRGSAGSRWTCPSCTSPSKVHIPALPPGPHGWLNKSVPGLIQGLLSKFPRRGGLAVLSGPSPARASQALLFM